MKYVMLLILMSISSCLLAQDNFNEIVCSNEPCTTDSSFFFQQVIKNTRKSDSLLADNSAIPKEIKAEVMAALGFFPELANTNIQFLYKPISQTMNARPKLGNLLQKKAQRHYLITINNNRGKHKGLPIEKLSFNIKVGWFGHELAHICEYAGMSNWKTIFFGLRYGVSKKYNRKVERYTDLSTIKHNLAFPLFEGVRYLLNDTTISNKYKQKIKDNYLSLDEIFCFWCKISKGIGK